MTFNVKIQQHNPEITDRDRRRGYTNRYFAAKANQIKDRAYEISLREFKRLKSDPYVVTAKTTWVISGPLEDHERDVTFQGPSSNKEPVIIPGVLTQNKSSIIFVSKKIPAIKKILKDPQEFYIDEASTG